MSYILEALKQSEDRRKQEAPADPSPVPAFASHRTARRSGRLPLAAALLGGIALLGWWTLDRTDATPETAIASGGSGTLQGAASGERSLSTADAPGGEAPVAPVGGVAEMIVAAIGNDELKGVRIQLDDAPAVPRTPPARRSDDQAALPRGSENHVAADTAGMGEKSQPQDRSDAYAGLPFRRQLPVDVQRSLPELVFSVHIYSADPASRRVKIGERMMREGQRITPQLRLEEIIPKGVILSYEDHRFRMNAL